MQSMPQNSRPHFRAGHTRPTAKEYSSSRGIALVTALILLVVITLLGVTMFRSFIVQERNAGNTREKQRAFEAGESTLRYAERWLIQGNGTAPATCNSLVSADTDLQSVVVCSNALTSAQAAAVPWKVSTGGAELGYSYTPPSFSLVKTGGSAGYAITPRFYLSSLGLDPSGVNEMYQVTAMARGGDSSSNVVVQSVYTVSPNFIDGNQR